MKAELTGTEAFWKQLRLVKASRLLLGHQLATFSYRTPLQGHAMSISTHYLLLRWFEVVMVRLHSSAIQRCSGSSYHPSHPASLCAQRYCCSKEWGWNNSTDYSEKGLEEMPSKGIEMSRGHQAPSLAPCTSSRLKLVLKAESQCTAWLCSEDMFNGAITFSTGGKSTTIYVQLSPWDSGRILLKLHPSNINSICLAD